MSSNIRNMGAPGWIVTVNVVLFVVVHLTGKHLPELLEWLTLPPTPAGLANEPWSFATYMFTQYSPMQLIFNMTLLYFYCTVGHGNQWGALGWRLWGLYALSGIAGAALYYVAIMTAWADSTGLTGASASVLGVIMYVTLKEPRIKSRMIFFGSVELRILTLVIVLLSVIAAGTNHIDTQAAHAGGIIAGSIVWLWQKKEWKKSNIAPVKSEMTANNVADAEMLDILLDKIRRSGYGSLTAEERDRLFQLSKRISP